FRESVYHKALAREMELRGIKFVSEPSLKVDYKGVNVGTHEPDFVVEDEVVVQLKVAEAINDVHVVQLVSSLKATGKKIGLILNFAKKTMREGIRRVVL
ncbi:MAG: GxxExxY protein, partial [Planctomycetes bacterium]|nr:GxxExxY protein [Planctomycetota bacterium]